MIKPRITPPLNLIILLLTAALMLACTETTDEQSQDTQAVSPVVSDVPVTDATDPFVAAASHIDSDDLHRHIRTLSSDEFGGRAPFSEGEVKTLDYLETAFRDAGMQPGYEGSFRQPVNLVAITAEAADISISHSGGSMSLSHGPDIVSWTTQVTDAVAVEDSELVFVGYGIVAPEYNWNDYDGVDVTGKTVMMLVNDPGFATQNPDLFNGNEMTYYGRWTYKFEEAARQGATAAILIHDTIPASYPWGVVINSWTGAQFHLDLPDGNSGNCDVEAWITKGRATDVLKAAGLDLTELEDLAQKPGFKPVETALRISTGFGNQIEKSTSWNIVAMHPGKSADAIIFTAHWDHLGTDQALVDAGEDGIYNGAVDNATGLAAMIELAEAYASLEQTPERSTYFVAVTAEESGLLGSRQFVETPPVPTHRMVAGINMDAMSVLGKTSDMVVIGYDSSELEDLLADAAGKQNRSVVPEPTPERGYYYRSDHFNFAKQGVPFLYAKAGLEHLKNGLAWAQQASAEYGANRYHKPGDEYDASWDLSGMVEDVQLYLDIALTIAYSNDWPNWYEGNEFRAIRDASMAGKP